MSKSIAKNKKQKKHSTLWGPILAVILLSVVLSIVTSKFLTMNNILNIMRQTSVNSLVAFGMLFVLLTGGIDLSQGSIVGFSMGIITFLYLHGIENSFLMIVLPIAVGTLCGLINGLVFTKLHLPHPFVSTLGMMQVLRGVTLIITQSKPVSGFAKPVLWVGSASIFRIPVCFLLVIAVVAVVSIFLNKTPMGRQIYSVGGNLEAARLAGIKVDFTLTTTYALSGLMCGLAAIVLVGRVGSTYPLAGEGYEMDAVAACVIGGASFSGGKGTVGGTLVGALIIAVVNNGLNLLGASQDVQKVVLGIVIILAVLVDVTRTQSSEKKRRLAQASSENA
ncbi:ABC transporter permease [Ruminococcus gauvreauii]|uniref:ABC transporter permease n=1 Tax=Ruminococcus gauvreauii TaxID=438033 RepID=A0ABY5VF73_9FIRM|nr:ABC transporter permease [Ruminococcus gauvreauii]UWP58888.1 ABC transporter permease [Ruminococcus gauvreauii]